MERGVDLEVNYQRENICRSVLNDMREFIVVQAEVAEVHLELILLQ